MTITAKERELMIEALDKGEKVLTQTVVQSVPG